MKLDVSPASVCSTISAASAISTATALSTGRAAAPRCLPDREGELSERESGLARYGYGERKAILDHRFFLSIEFQREATFDETIRSWESGVCVPWRREKMRRDRIAQLKEIERHKYYLSMQCGYDIGPEAAADDWIQHHAAPWREWWEHHWWEKQWWEREAETEAQKRPIPQLP